MKLLYTDIQFDMTEILARKAMEEAKAGKRVSLAIKVSSCYNVVNNKENV